MTKEYAAKLIGMYTNISSALIKQSESLSLESEYISIAIKYRILIRTEEIIKEFEFEAKSEMRFVSYLYLTMKEIFSKEIDTDILEKKADNFFETLRFALGDCVD